MDLNMVRMSGIAVSGALIAGAIYIAATAPRVVEHSRTSPPPAALPTPQTHPATAHPAFAVSLRGDGPLARAQRLAMRGGHERLARLRVERALTRQRAFQGLCFDHFAARGDVVLRACASSEGTDWAARLRAVPTVTNVDAVSQLQQDGRGD